MRAYAGRLAAIASALCLLGALVAGLVPVAAGGVPCGTWVASLVGGNEVVYEGSYAPLRELNTEEAVASVADVSFCSEVLDTRGLLTLGLLGVGGALTVYALLARRRRRDIA